MTPRQQPRRQRVERDSVLAATRQRSACITDHLSTEIEYNPTINKLTTPCSNNEHTPVSSHRPHPTKLLNHFRGRQQKSLGALGALGTLAISRRFSTKPSHSAKAKKSKPIKYCTMPHAAIPDFLDFHKTPPVQNPRVLHPKTGAPQPSVQNSKPSPHSTVPCPLPTADFSHDQTR